MSQTTKADFVKFQQYATAWQKKLGLLNWALYFDHKKKEGAYAQTAWDMGGSLATITLATHWDDMRKKTDNELNSLALHEVLHVLFAEFTAFAEARYLHSDSLEMAEHSILRRLENVLMEYENAKV